MTEPDKAPRAVIAIHEAGHAVVAWALKVDVLKVSIAHDAPLVRYGLVVDSPELGAQIVAAGPIAQSLFTAWAGREGWKKDESDFESYIELIANSPNSINDARQKISASTSTRSGRFSPAPDSIAVPAVRSRSIGAMCRKLAAELEGRAGESPPRDMEGAEVELSRCRRVSRRSTGARCRSGRLPIGRLKLHLRELSAVTQGVTRAASRLPGPGAKSLIL